MPHTGWNVTMNVTPSSDKFSPILPKLHLTQLFHFSSVALCNSPFQVCEHCNMCWLTLLHFPCPVYLRRRWCGCRGTGRHTTTSSCSWLTRKTCATASRTRSPNSSHRTMTCATLASRKCHGTHNFTGLYLLNTFMYTRVARPLMCMIWYERDKD